MIRRLLLLCTDLEIGGTPTVVRELALRLGAAGMEVEVSCLSRQGPIGRQLHDANVRVTALDAAGPADLRVFPRLWRLIGERRYNAVLSFLVHANVAAAAVKPACASEIRWFQSIQTTQPNPRWHWAAQAAAQLAAEKIIVPSESVARAARDWSMVPASKIVVIPNAVDTPGSLPIRPVARKPFRIGFIGRLDPVKRVPDLLSAVELLDDVRLHIYGDGRQHAEIESAVTRRGLSGRVTLHGAVSNVQESFATLDALVLPSQAEGFGLVLIEAMAAGVPVIATDAPGIRDVVRDGFNGLLVPVASPPALAHAIGRVMRDAALRQALVRRGFEDVRRRFSWETVIPQYLALPG